MSQATVRIAFPSAADAETARAALEPDNDGFLHATIEGSGLVVTASSDSVMGLLRTLDDVLGCLRASGVE